jgi:hypothetical protein
LEKVNRFSRPGADKPDQSEEQSAHNDESQAAVVHLPLANVVQRREVLSFDLILLKGLSRAGSVLLP